MSEIETAKRLLPIVEEQEKLVEFPSFSADDAFEIGSLLRSNYLAKYNDGKNGVAISIQLFNGDVLFRASVGNKRAVTAENWEWIAAKVRVVGRYNCSSFYAGRKAVASGKEFGRFGPEPIGAQPGEVFAQHGGAVPIKIKGCSVAPVGAIVISGLTQEDDHQLVIDTLAQYLKIQSVPSIV